MGDSALRSFLVATPFFGGLDDAQLDRLIAMLVERRYPVGARVFAEGDQGRSMYIAVFSALTGLVGAAAPLAGGLAVRALHGLSLTVLSFHLSSLHLLFLASSLIQAVSILPALRIREPAATAPSAVLLQLKNDLNPQTGIASSADFVLLEVRRGRRVLREVDRRTERLARMSERRISVIADRLGSATAGIRARLRRYLQDTYDDAG